MADNVFGKNDNKEPFIPEYKWRHLGVGTDLSEVPKKKILISDLLVSEISIDKQSETSPKKPFPETETNLLSPSNFQGKNKPFVKFKSHQKFFNVILNDNPVPQYPDIPSPSPTKRSAKADISIDISNRKKSPKKKKIQQEQEYFESDSSEKSGPAHVKFKVEDQFYEGINISIPSSNRNIAPQSPQFCTETQFYKTHKSNSTNPNMKLMFYNTSAMLKKKPPVNQKKSAEQNPREFFKRTGNILSNIC